MGAADIVPGVSGGTVALVLGIYERLVASIRAASLAIADLVRLRIDLARGWLRRVDWLLVLGLGAGILLAVLVLARLIEHQLAVSPVQMAALFLGFVAGSTVIVWRLLRGRTWVHLVLAVGVAVVVFAALGLREGTSDETVSQVSDPATLAVFLSGAVAICAMILPGISGSFILVMLGMYQPVLGAVNDRNFTLLAVFVLGAAVGLGLFSQVLHWALARYHDVVMAGLVGLMAGSVRVLWPWPDGVDSTALGAPDGAVAASVALAVAGFSLVVALHWAASRIERAEVAAVLRGTATR